MRTFTLYWIDNTTSTISGRDFAQACARAGYGSAMLYTLDYYREVSVRAAA
jgi:hypothetical protein